MGIKAEDRWWSETVYANRRRKSGKIEHTTFIMEAVPNEALATCFIERHPSMDPDATCDVHIRRNALAENCSVLEPPAANPDAKDMMEAWHLWQSLGATENQIQSLILPNIELRMHEEVEEVGIWSPNYPRSLQTVWNGFNEQTMGIRRYAA